MRQLLTGVLMACLAGAAAAAPDVIRTETGWLQGQAADDGMPVTRYLGIPFAAPPTGALRWRAPQPPEPWQGTRTATEFAPACAQIGNFFASDDAATFGQPYGSEDCLYLNVWVPTSDAGPPRPVLVFVHGGAGIAGSASLPAYDGSRLAHELDAVVVSIQYRLGILGGLHRPELKTGDPLDDSGAFGLLDQIAALRWLQNNVAAFGGDPERVTVMGHSAGAVSLWSLFRSPLATGLFSRAISLSGIPLSHDEAALDKRARRFVDKLTETGHDISDADDLRALTTAQVLEAGADLKAMGGFRDGTVLPDADPDSAAGLLNAVPTLIGNVDNEASMLLVFRYSHLDRQELWNRFQNHEDARRADLLSLFANLRFRIASRLFNGLVNRRLDNSAELLRETGVPVYRYVFAWDDFEPPWRDIFGACHGLDIPFVFGNFQEQQPHFFRFAWSPRTLADRELIHRDMAVAIANFIRQADPDPLGDDWPAWDDREQMKRIR